MTKTTGLKQSHMRGRLYSAVSRYWPRIAAVTVAVVGVVEFVVGGFSADPGVELFVFAWGACTGGLWFLFEKGEKTISDGTREKIATALLAADFRRGFAQTPRHFAVLFDRVFSAKHWSRRCFYRSALASLASSALVLSVLISTGIGGWSGALGDPVSGAVGPWVQWRSATSSFGMSLPLFFIFAVVLNILPDYLSLLETRWVIGKMEASHRVLRLMGLDLIITSIIAWASIWMVLALRQSGFVAAPFDLIAGRSMATPFFYTAFFTSAWLWIYAVAAGVARVLTRLSSGFGVLLSVTDVSHQPLRALGFVAVVLVSLLFVALFPFVLI